MVVGAPVDFSKPLGPPRSQSSRTGTKKKSILSKLFADLKDAFLNPTAAIPTRNSAPFKDIKKSDQILTMRGVIKPDVQAKPNNMMAGTPAPPPLSGAPKVPGGNKPPPAIPSVGGPMVAGGPMTPKVQMPTGGPIAGTLRLRIPVDSHNKPILSKITDISFITGPIKALAAKAGAALPIPKTRVPLVKTVEGPTVPPQAVLPPPPVPPPAVFTGNKSRKYRDGRRVLIRRGRSITVYPNGRKVVMRRRSNGKMRIFVVSRGRTIRTVRKLPGGGKIYIKIRPNGLVRTVTKTSDGKTVITIQRPGQPVRTIVKRGRR